MTLKWLLHSYQQSLLNVLFSNPHATFHISEFARQAGIDSGNTKRYVEKFAKQGIIDINKTSKMTFLKANLENAETRKLFELFELNRTTTFLNDHNLAKRILPILISAIELNIEGIQLIAVCGAAAASGKTLGHLDLLIVLGNGHSTKEAEQQVERLCKDVGLPLEIKLLVISTKEFEQGWQNDDQFLCDFWRDRFVLSGETYLWKIIARLGIPNREEKHQANRSTGSEMPLPV